MKLIVLILTLILSVWGQVTSSTATISNTNTLVPNVVYNMKFGFTGDNIPAGSTVNV